MWRKTMMLSGLVAGLTLSAGCSSDVADPILGSGGDLEAAMIDVALETDRITAEMLTGELDALGGGTGGGAGMGDGTKTVTKSFDLTRSCPAGGEINVQGMLVRTFDSETGVMEAESSGSHTRTDCGFFHEDLTIIVNGSSQWETFRRRVNGIPDGPQTAHYAGSWTAVSSAGEEKSCTFDYTIVRDPGSMTKTIEGTICGKTVGGSVTWEEQD